MNFFDQFLFLFSLEAVVPLGEAGLTGTILNQYKLDGHFSVRKTVF
jgi:hypothetical protein